MSSCEDLLYYAKSLFSYEKKDWPTEYIEELPPEYPPPMTAGIEGAVYWPAQIGYSEETGTMVLIEYGPEADLESITYQYANAEGIVTFDDGTELGTKRRVKLWKGRYPDGTEYPLGSASLKTQSFLYQVGSPFCWEKELKWRWYEGEYMYKVNDEVEGWHSAVETIVVSGEAAQSHVGGGGRHTRPTPGGSGQVMAGAGSTGGPGGRGGPMSVTHPAVVGGSGSSESSGTPVNTQPFAIAMGPDVMMHANGLDLMQRTADEVLEAWGTRSHLDSSAWQIGGIISRAIRGKLIAKGYTNGQVDWFMEQGKLTLVDPVKDVVSNTVGSNSRVHDTPTNRRAVPELPDQRVNIPKEGAPSAPSPTNIVVRAPYGYMRPDTSELADMRPQLTQFYPELIDVGGPIPLVQRSVETFYFPYIPQNVQYQGLGSEWQEIPRAADLPIVEWSKWHLLKATMEFLIAEKADGIYQSVHEEIETLRRMAQRPYPVSVYGMDQLLRISMRRAAETGKALEFVIADLSLSSLRRTMHAGDKEVTAAQVKITLQEIPIEEIRLAEFPTPGFGNDPGPATPDATGDCLDPLTKYTTAPTQTSAGTGGISPYAPEWSASDGCDGDNRDPRYQHVR